MSEVTNQALKTMRERVRALTEGAESLVQSAQAVIEAFDDLNRAARRATGVKRLIFDEKGVPTGTRPTDGDVHSPR